MQLVAGSPNPIINELRHERLRRGLTLSDIARALDVTTSAVGNWEKLNRTPSVLCLYLWAHCLGYDIVLQRRPT